MHDLDIAAEHAGLVAALAAAGKPYRGDPQGADSYSGSRHPFYFVSAPERRRMVREWLKARKPTPAQALALADAHSIAIAQGRADAAVAHAMAQGAKAQESP